MYLDKPMKDHTLLQAICRTNRLYGKRKHTALIVDYIGILTNVTKALDFDEKAVQTVNNEYRRSKGLTSLVDVQMSLAFPWRR
jgi:type I site-specific restriction-modification system R (restriction) subunit